MKLKEITKITDLPEEFLKNYNEAPEEFDVDDVLWYLSDETHMSPIEEDVFQHKSRWESRYRSVLYNPDTKKYWAYEFTRGNTEYQDAEPFVVVYEVIRKEVTATVYEVKK